MNYKKDDKIICTKDNLWVPMGAKGVVVQDNLGSRTFVYALWDITYHGSNIKLYVELADIKYYRPYKLKRKSLTSA